MKRPSLIVVPLVLAIVIVIAVIGIGQVTKAFSTDFTSGLRGFFMPSDEIPAGQLLPDPKAQRISDERKFEIAQRIADKVDLNSQMPIRSQLAEGSLSADSSVAEMLQTLAVEMQSTELLGLVRTYQKNAKQLEELRLKAAHAALAEERGAEQAPSSGEGDKIERLLEENDMMLDQLRVAFADAGISLTKEEVTSLCASPNSDDIIGLAATFQSLSTLTRIIQQRVLDQPDPESAQQYYATYTVLLIAFDKIQRNAIQKLNRRHIPRVLAIRQDAEETRVNSMRLRASREATPFAHQLLTKNITRLDSTISQAKKSELALNAQSSKLQQANKKLGFAIAMATNTHRTLLVQRELSDLIESCQADIEALQELSLPPMLIVNLKEDEIQTGYMPGEGKN